MGARETIVQRIREWGPMTVAEFMDIALYDPEHGYYASAAQRSGRAGDFYTSVDVGPLFGSLLAVQFEEMWRLLGRGPFDLVEAAAGNGRLTKDVLDAAARDFPAFHDAIRVTLVERSDAARAAQRDTLGPHAVRLASSTTELPRRVTGVIFANELLDALPVHVVVMTGEGTREIRVGERNGALVEVAGEPSQAARAELSKSERSIPPGVRAEVCPAARQWIGRAAAALEHGFLLLVDYGHEEHELYSDTHRDGTLVAYRAHTAGAVRWIDDPGHNDLTAHVNLTAVRHAASAAGLHTLGIVDQTYFLLALGLAERLDTGTDPGSLKSRLAARTLIMPGGLGSTMKVMLFARGVEAPAIRGLANGRLT